MSRLGTLLQIDDRTWGSIDHQQLRSRALVVLFAYGILAWNRFGLLSFTAPRAPLRLVLIGIYGWLGLALLLTLAARFNGAPIDPHRATIAAAVAHVPLVFLAFFMAIVAGFARVLGPGVIATAVVVGLWMPAILARAFATIARLPLPAAVGAAIGTQLLWLAGPGRYLYDRVGHLL